MNSKTVSQNLLKEVPERAREIILRRFALGKNKKFETLESIGNSFKITRERVRQIERDGIKKAKKMIETPGIKEDFDNLINIFEKELNACGGFKKESSILKNNNIEEEKNNIIFLLSLSDKIIREKEDNNFYCFWSLSKDKSSIARGAIQNIIKNLKDKGFPETFNNLFSDYKAKENKETFCNYLEISKNILRTLDGEKIGLSSWPEVNPKTVKDKIRLILKKEKKPIHFKDVTDMVTRLPQRRNLHPQTIHNELIRNYDFILVGRGYYALKEWGYRHGQVKDVIYQVLSASEGGLPKEEIVNSVLDQRMVKKSTILINLQNKKFFKKDEGGKYKIKEA